MCCVHWWRCRRRRPNGRRATVRLPVSTVPLLHRSVLHLVLRTANGGLCSTRGGSARCRFGQTAPTLAFLLLLLLAFLLGPLPLFLLPPLLVRPLFIRRCRTCSASLCSGRSAVRALALGLGLTILPGLVDDAKIPEHQIADEHLLVKRPTGISKLDMTEAVDSAFHMDGIARIHAQLWRRGRDVILRGLGRA